MTVHCQFYVVCSQCNNQFISNTGDHYGETSEEVLALAMSEGWHCQILVPNGSFWDFCPKCYEYYKSEHGLYEFIDVVFDGPPGPESGRFVEVENPEGASINAGEWIDRGDGYWALRIKLSK